MKSNFAAENRRNYYSKGRNRSARRKFERSAQYRARKLAASEFFSRAYSKSQNPIKLDHLPRGTFELQPTVSACDKPTLHRADYHNSRNTGVISRHVISSHAYVAASKRFKRSKPTVPRKVAVLNSGVPQIKQ